MGHWPCWQFDPGGALMQLQRRHFAQLEAGNSLWRHQPSISDAARPRNREVSSAVRWLLVTVAAVSASLMVFEAPVRAVTCTGAPYDVCAVKPPSPDSSDNFEVQFSGRSFSASPLPNGQTTFTWRVCAYPTSDPTCPGDKQLNHISVNLSELAGDCGYTILGGELGGNPAAFQTSDPTCFPADAGQVFKIDDGGCRHSATLGAAELR